MSIGSFFKGTSHDQDVRFKNKEQKLILGRKWPPEFEKPVDINKVELGIIKPWIEKRVTELLGFEDEVVSNLALSELEAQSTDRPLCPKKMQINLTGFLDKNASIFMTELWNLLLSAQESGNGIPPQLIEEKKEELQRKKEQIQKTKEKLENLQRMMASGENPSSAVYAEAFELAKTTGGLSATRTTELGNGLNKTQSKDIQEPGLTDEAKKSIIDKATSRIKDDLKRKRRDRSDSRDRRKRRSKSPPRRHSRDDRHRDSRRRSKPSPRRHRRSRRDRSSSSESSSSSSSGSSSSGSGSSSGSSSSRSSSSSSEDDRRDKRKHTASKPKTYSEDKKNGQKVEDVDKNRKNGEKNENKNNDEVERRSL